jgi:hypothetical protein
MSTIALEPVDHVEITVLIDNVTDPLLVDQDAVRRVNWPRALHGALPRAVQPREPRNRRARPAHRRARVLGPRAHRGR